ncbi:hypothetical protein Ae201684P_019018 [Aphanomyces euteiches]|uniref:Tc1-like transposase DDE domain-containing protein n=1 Tax=Aphanomyces euteiches TaxID=100861 RepID=A0A6G0XVF8_9STRA|nr:hypothetical protein Ae201684_001114 [Aphanomyces euteiches]KAH9100013.1 hypothetical protein Ae201684P_019018 [Aphanomyces euteiches]
MSSQGCTEIDLLSGPQDSSAYCGTIANYLIPFVRAKHPRGFVFQQDNTSIHTSRETMEFLKDQNIAVMRWPALSPDLNPIKNLWGVLTRKVYVDGKQCSSVGELKAEILKQSQTIDNEVILKLISSIKSRCIKVFQAKGSLTKL